MVLGFINISICLFAQCHCCKTDSNITLCCQILTNACQVMVSAPTYALTLRDLIVVNAPQGSSWIQMEDLARVCYSLWTWIQVSLRQRRSTGKCLFFLSHPSSFTTSCKPQGQIPHEALYRCWVDRFLLKTLRMNPLVCSCYRSWWMFAGTPWLPAKV